MKSTHPTHRKNPLHRARRALSAWSAAALLGVTVLGAATLSTGSASASGDIEISYGPHMGGRAYGVGFFGTTVLGAPIPPGYGPDTGWVSTTYTRDFTAACGNVNLAIVSATLNCGKVSTNAEYRTSVASTSVATARVGIPGIPTVDVKAVNATSKSACFSELGSHGSVTIAYLKVGTKVLIAQPTQITPNTKLVVGPVSLTLNEQYPSDNGFTVNAIHLAVNVPGVATTNAVISSATSSVSNCNWD